MKNEKTDEIRLLDLIDRTLNPSGGTQDFNQETKLLGDLPELDSLGVANLIAAIEVEFQMKIEDDEIDGSVFQTLGTLLAFIKNKIGSN